MISLRKYFLAACMLFRSFAGNEYNHWLTEYEKDVKRNHMLVVHMFTILPGTAILNKSKGI